MKTNVTLSQMYFNYRILDFFFRKQARRTFEEIIKRAGDTQAKFDELTDAIEGYYDSIDEFEEDCYNMTATEVLDNLEIEYK